MTLEDKEELKPQEPEEDLETSEQAPAEEEQQDEVPESESPKGEEESEVEGSEPEGDEAHEETIEVSKAEYEKLQEERDNYRTGLLAEKGKKRKTELDLVEEPKEGSEPTGTLSDIQKDYQSKRADALADYESKLAGLSQPEFDDVKYALKVDESKLLDNAKKSNRYVARKHIQDMLDKAMRFGKKEPQKETDLPPGADVGSTKTIRKVASTSKISEKARALQPYTKDPKTGKITSVEAIQGMIDRGEIN